MYLEWIKRGLQRPGKTQAGLARHLGKSEATISRLVKGTVRLPTELLDGIAQYLGEPVPSGRIGPATIAREIAVVGTFGGNLWRDIDEVPVTHRSVPMPDIPSLRQLDCYAMEAAASLDDGQAYVVCVRIEGVGRPVRADDRVHYVEQHQQAASMVRDRIGIVENVGSVLMIRPIMPDDATKIPLKQVRVFGLVAYEGRSYAL